MTEPTTAQLHGANASRIIDAIARKLEAVAEEVRRYQPEMEKGGGTANVTAADVIKCVTERVGNLGGFYWDLLYSSARADMEFRQVEADKRIQGYINEWRNEV